MAQNGQKDGHSTLPTKEALLEFINDQPNEPTKRDIARAFGIKGADRIELKKLLKQLEGEGKLVRARGKKMRKRGSVPAVAALVVDHINDDGDPIAVPTKWDEGRDGPMPHILVTPDKKSGSKPLGLGDRFLGKINQTGDAAIPYSAQIMRRFEKTTGHILGVFKKLSGAGGVVNPIDRKMRFEISVAHEDTANASNDELVLVAPHQAGRYGPRRGRVVKRFGAKMDDARNISLIAIHELGIPDEFPSAVIKQAKAAKPVTDISNRVDLRHLPLLTIDPADARDHDDAVWAAPDDDPANKGGFKVIVAIADVAHYVTAGSALDREARLRGNATYFPDRVVPMLPEELSADLCSLHEGEDRPALAVTITLDENGKKLHHRFERIMMHSVASLTYDDAQTAFVGEPNERAAPLAETVLAPLYQAWQASRKARESREPLALDLPEHKIILDDQGHVENVSLRQRFAAHELIEDFMIMANVCAAESVEKARLPALYRVHEAPDEQKLASLRDYVQAVGLSFAKGQTIMPHHFNRLLGKAEGTGHKTSIQEVVLRSQMQAIYSAENMGHFGLNLRRYSHFTSPIRRYADLYTHRALIRACKLGNDGIDDDAAAGLDQLASAISQTERRSMAAERSTVDRYMAHYMRERLGAEFEGTITGVHRAGLFVRLNSLGTDGLIPISRLPDDYYIHDEASFALVGEHSGLQFALGDRVDVRLIEAAPLKGALMFDLVTHFPSRKNTPSRSRRKKSGAPHRKHGKSHKRHKRNS